MSFEQCTFSPESAAGYSQTSSWDTSQLSLLSGSHTPAESCENGPPKDGSPACTCGKGTLDCSIHPSTPEAWTASMRDSLARTLALLESRQAYLREPDQVFTAKSCVSLAWFDRDSCSWRTFQQSFLTGSEPYSQTWPRWGMTLDGVAYEHPMSARRITETGGSYLPTPRAMDGRGAATFESAIGCIKRGFGPNLAEYAQMFPTPNAAPFTSDLALTCSGDGRKKPNKLGWYVAMWPTPVARDYRSPGRSRLERTGSKAGECLPQVVGGQLNPNWVGWLMGFPIAWANSKATETPKSRSKPPQLGECSEAAK